MSDRHRTATGASYREAADRQLADAHEEPMSLESYVEAVFETPAIAAHASKYLLAAIESAGTRTVVERGEELERYRFFDDPYNDGEHAIQGNTRVLNAFVDDLRSISAGRGKHEKIIWIAGPTATGKSELKRCLINGLREYSKTPDGRRYTLQWNVSTLTGHGGMSYGDPPGSTRPRGEDWYESPVQVHPLMVFPRDVRQDLLDELNRTSDHHVDIRLEGELDPFSREAFEHLADHYERRGTDELFSKITGTDHLQVTNYVVDVGRGIGVLHAEDEGAAKERLVGTWMHGMLRDLDSRGRKNPQAFSYDGILSQGNGVLTIVEDASQHADLLQRLLTVPDEARVKLDTGIEMTVDTQLLIISNPDLEARLDQHADAGGADPLKALKRRLDKHEFRYLTNLSLEAELLRRELTGETAVWTAETYAELEDRIRAPVRIDVRDAIDGVVARELAPHTIEAAAMFAVLTRLDDADLPSALDLVDKALLYDRGYHFAGDERLALEDFAIEGDADGTFGIPVTYTRDIIAELMQSPRDRHHPTLAVEDVLLPDDVLDRMADELGQAPVFSTREREEYEERVVPVKHYVRDRQEEDVLEAILHDHRVDASTIEEYVEHVYAWGTDETIVDARGAEVEPDPLKMKLVEVEQLGRFPEDAYDGDAPGEPVEAFRRSHVINALNRYAWEQRDEDFTVGDVALSEIPTIAKLMEHSSWDDVDRVFEDFDPRQWPDPPDGTETASVKSATIDVMAERMGYSPASAELTSRRVLEERQHGWGGDA